MLYPTRREIGLWVQKNKTSFDLDIQNGEQPPPVLRYIPQVDSSFMHPVHKRDNIIMVP